MKYRLIKRFPGAAQLGAIYVEGDNFGYDYKGNSEFFQVLEPDFKVGDWIYVTDAPDIHPDWKGWVDKITFISNVSIDTTGRSEYPTGLAFTRNTYKFRLATEEEIDSVNKFKIAGYKVEFTKYNTGIGCENHNNRCWKALNDYMSEFNLASITHTSGTKVTYDEITELVKRLK